MGVIGVVEAPPSLRPIVLVVALLVGALGAALGTTAGEPGPGTGPSAQAVGQSVVSKAQYWIVDLTSTSSSSLHPAPAAHARTPVQAAFIRAAS